MTDSQNNEGHTKFLWINTAGNKLQNILVLEKNNVIGLFHTISDRFHFIFHWIDFFYSFISFRGLQSKAAAPPQQAIKVTSTNSNVEPDDNLVDSDVDVQNASNAAQDRYVAILR